MIPKFDLSVLQSICNVLGHTDDGLKGTEIGRLLKECNIADPGPITKAQRLYQALSARQEKDSAGNIISVFIQHAMAPARYLSHPERFEDFRYQLNEGLSFAGFSLGQDGKLQTVQPATIIDQARERAGRLRAELQRRRVHGDVLRFCQAELLQENYFHAVLEATKSVADKLRSRTGLISDGAALVDEALGLGSAGMPRLAINSLQTETEKSEHTGLMNLLKGTFGAFRNVTAHAPKITWRISEQDALDLMTLCSLLHRKLDSAVRTPRA